MPQWWHRVGSVGGSGWTVMSAFISETKKFTWAAGEAEEVNPQHLPRAPKKAAAPTHALGIYFITRSRSDAPRQLCNHLVCFHIHSHEAVICRALGEAGRQGATVLPSLHPCCCHSAIQGFPHLPVWQLLRQKAQEAHNNTSTLGIIISNFQKDWK